MPIFKAPQYIKRQNTSGVLESCYKFPIEIVSADDIITYIAEDDINIETLRSCIIDNVNWWKSFLAQFISSSSKHFTKSYTVDVLNKHISHSLEKHTDIIDFPVNVTFSPKEIIIFQGKFVLIWTYEVTKMIIEAPDLEDDDIESDDEEQIVDLGNIKEAINDIAIPDSAKHINNTSGLEEYDMDSLPINNSGELELKGNTSRYYEKRKVKEARLRAKLAVYKAERELSKYYEKYGTDVSDSDTDASDSEGETDYETDEN